MDNAGNREHCFSGQEKHPQKQETPFQGEQKTAQRWLFGIPSLERTVRPRKLIGIRSFPFGMDCFQGQTVSFRDCIFFLFKQIF